MDCNLKQISGVCKSNTVYISTKVDLKKEMGYISSYVFSYKLCYILTLPGIDNITGIHSITVSYETKKIENLISMLTCLRDMIKNSLSVLRWPI